jgi:hypothetical protein
MNECVGEWNLRVGDREVARVVTQVRRTHKLRVKKCLVVI